jgi:hypothetical protein
MVVRDAQKQLDALNISVYTFKEELEKIEKVNVRAADKLKRQAKALGWVDDELNFIRKSYNQDIKAIRVAEQRLAIWQKRFAGVKTIIQHHAAEITAAAGVGVALKNLMEQYTTATTQLVQTTGQLGDNAMDAAKRADDLADAYRKAVATAGSFGHSAEEAKKVADDLVKLFGGDVVGQASYTEAISVIGSMASVTGQRMEEFSALYKKRFMEQGKTMEETNIEFGHVIVGYEKLRMASELQQKYGSNIATQFREDFVKSTVMAAEEISSTVADLDKVNKITGAVAERAMQLGLKLGDINRITANIGKLFKLPEVMQFEVGREVIRDVLAERAKRTGPEFDAFLAENFKGQEEIVKLALEKFETKKLPEWDTAMLLMSAGAGKGLVMAKQMQRLSKMAQNSSNFISILHEQMGIDQQMAFRIWSIFDRGGTVEEVVREMERDSKATAGKDRQADAKAAAATNAARAGIKKQHDAAKNWLNEFKSWLHSQFQSPIRSMIITLGGLGSWALLNVVANRIIAGQVAGVRRSAEAAALAAGAPGAPAAAVGAAGSVGKVGGWFSRHKVAGSVLAVGAAVGIGVGLNQLSQSDPTEMQAELEKLAGLNPGDLGTYSQPERVNAALTAEAAKRARSGDEATKTAEAARTKSVGPAITIGAAGIPETQLGRAAEAQSQRMEAAVMKSAELERPIAEGITGFGTPGLAVGLIGTAETYAREYLYRGYRWLAYKTMPKKDAYSATDVAKAKAIVFLEIAKLAATPQDILSWMRPVAALERWQEMDITNRERALRASQDLLEDIKRSGNAQKALTSREGKQRLEVIKAAAGAAEAERIRAAALAGRMTEETLRQRQELSLKIGAKVTMAAGLEKQQVPTGREVMIGTDGRPLERLTAEDLRLKFRANMFDYVSGALVCEWTNPEVVSTIFQAVKQQAKGKR